MRLIVFKETLIDFNNSSRVANVILKKAGCNGYFRNIELNFMYNGKGQLLKCLVDILQYFVART